MTRKILIGAAAVVGLFVVSFVSDQIQSWFSDDAPEPPPIIEGHLDLGRAVAPPSSTPGHVAAPPPVINVSLPTQVQQLDMRQLIAVLEKYGYAQQAEQLRDVTDDGDDPPPTGHVLPLNITEKTFGPGPAGDSLDCAATLLAPGAPVDLRCVFHDYQPPPPTRPEKTRWYFGNEARFEWFVMAGYAMQYDGLARVVDATGAVAAAGDDTRKSVEFEPGVAAGVAYKSWRANKVTLDARMLAVATYDRGSGALRSTLMPGLGFSCCSEP